MRKIELENCPKWLLDATTLGEDITITDGAVIWHGGTWYGGTWRDGDWYGGTWYGSNWHGGNWYGGAWYGGNWYGGNWKKGIVKGSPSKHYGLREGLE